MVREYPPPVVALMRLGLVLVGPMYLVIMACGMSCVLCCVDTLGNFLNYVCAGRYLPRQKTLYALGVLSQAFE